MPFCPNCKNEYRQGFTQCHECKVPLVDSLEELENQQMKPKKFFDVNDERSYEFLDQYVEEEEDEEESEIVSYSDLSFKEAQFDQKEEAEEEEEDYNMVSISEQMMRQRQIAESMRKKSSYVDKKQKIEDYKSSGFVLTFVGTIGLIALILLYFGFIPGFAGLKSNYMFMGVMFVMFVCFIVAGIGSFMQIKTIVLEAEADQDITTKVTDFMAENLTAEKIAEAVILSKSDTPEEMYFKRTEYMTKVVFHQFPSLNEALREQLIDEKYGELYEDNNS